MNQFKFYKKNLTSKNNEAMFKSFKFQMGQSMIGYQKKDYFIKYPMDPSFEHVVEI
jgi:hypothetical protein